MSLDFDKFLDESLQLFTKKILWEVERLDGAIPYIPIDGVYSDKGKEDISWWTNGFWGGLLWQLHSINPNQSLVEGAVQLEKRLDGALDEFTGLHHDVGFQWHLSAVANYKLNNDEEAKQRGLKAANILAGRYNPNGEFLRCWNMPEATGWVIVDSLMNLPLLYWASEEFEDPRFKDIAVKHVDTVLEHMIRKDGSSAHIGSFDPASGEFIEWLTGQGYAPESSWTRGQAWAVYGLALTYKYTKEEKYLEAAKRSANYFISNIAVTDFVPSVDFRGELTDERTDTSAGLAALCGILEISDHVDAAEAHMYRENAKKMFVSITDRHANFDLDEDGIIGDGTVAYHRDVENNVPIVYSDFFYIDAISRFKKNDFNIW